MNEITLMDAIHRMYVHKDKKMPIRFWVSFDDGITRKANFGKSWSKTMKTWTYFVQDGAYEPRFAYQEREAVSAIMSISGMKLYGASVRYHIQQEGVGTCDEKTARSPCTSRQM